jgi:hypothetical protein
VNDIKGNIAEIRKVLGEENAEKVNNILSDIQSAYISVDADNKANVRESMGRKEKIREQADKISDLEDRVEKLSDTTKFKELETENIALKTFQKQVQQKSKQTLIDKVKLYSADESFAKVKDMVGLATKTEPDADGKDQIVFDVDSMDDSGVNASLGKIIEYETIGVLGKVDPNGDPKPRDSKPNQQVNVKIEDPNKIDRKVQAKEDPEGYKKYREERKKIEFIK